MTATIDPADDDGEPPRVRVLLLSPARRLLLMKYRNHDPAGPGSCWTTCGGGRDPGETIEQCARRELAEETGLSGLRFGPVVWYGVDSHRGRHWNIVYREHFIVAFAPGEEISRAGWTEHERQNILETRWWSLDDLRRTSELVYPFGLADLLEPVLEGRYPETIVSVLTA